VLPCQVRPFDVQRGGNHGLGTDGGLSANSRQKANGRPVAGRALPEMGLHRRAQRGGKRACDIIRQLTDRHRTGEHYRRLPPLSPPTATALYIYIRAGALPASYTYRRWRRSALQREPR